MIAFDLTCRDNDHRFEGWFASSAAFADQQQRGLLTCPHCGSVNVEKAVMAPRVARKGNQTADERPATLPVAGGAMSPEAQKALAELARIQAQALSKSRWVGESFADESRAQHYGERESETIHGQATLEQAKELLDEGIAIMPLPFPVAPPDQTN